MPTHEDTLKRLSNDLEIYDEEYYDNFVRKAYNDDNVLIEKGVNVEDVISAFQLEKKEIYQELKSEIERNNNHNVIKNLIEEKRPYKILKVKYLLKNYDFCSRYNELCLQIIEETYKYNTTTREYKFSSYSTGGRNLKKYNLTYINLIDDTYNSIKKVVKKIKQLEKKNNTIF